MKTKLLLLAIFCTFKIFAQNDTTVVDVTKDIKEAASENQPVKVFYDQRLINVNTVEVLHKGIMEFKVSHHFGDIAGDNGGIKYFFGLDHASDVRIGFHIGLTDKLNIVASRTRGDEQIVGDNNLRVGSVQQLWELGLKYQFMRQMENDPKHPFSLTVYVNDVVSSMRPTTAPLKESAYSNFADRNSQLVQLMLARKFGNVSLQISPTYLHTNYVMAGDHNGLFALGGALRMPLTKKFFLIADYYNSFVSQESRGTADRHNIPLHDVFGIGIEILTEGHIFHMNFTNATNILENRFLTRTVTSWGDGQFRWGFTISRRFVLFRSKK